MIKKAILATLAYYDVFDYPLTAGEIFKFLINPDRFNKDQGSTFFKSQGRTFYKVIHIQGLTLNVDNFEMLVVSLAMLVSNGEVEEKIGFYFLPGRSALCRERIEKNKISELKWKKTRWYLFWAQAIPYVEVIFASGSLALGHTSVESDLDVLVVAKTS